jgi:hypothetical protein
VNGKKRQTERERESCGGFGQRKEGGEGAVEDLVFNLLLRSQSMV